MADLVLGASIAIVLHHLSDKSTKNDESQKDSSTVRGRKQEITQKRMKGGILDIVKLKRLAKKIKSYTQPTNVELINLDSFEDAVCPNTIPPPKLHDMIKLSSEDKQKIDKIINEIMRTFNRAGLLPNKGLRGGASRRKFFAQKMAILIIAVTLISIILKMKDTVFELRYAAMLSYARTQISLHLRLKPGCSVKDYKLYVAAGTAKRAGTVMVPVVGRLAPSLAPVVGIGSVTAAVVEEILNCAAREKEWWEQFWWYGNIFLKFVVSPLMTVTLHGLRKTNKLLGPLNTTVKFLETQIYQAIGGEDGDQNTIQVDTDVISNVESSVEKTKNKFKNKWIKAITVTRFLKKTKDVPH